MRPTVMPPATSCTERLRTGPRRHKQQQPQRTGRGAATPVSPQPTHIMATRTIPTADLLGMGMEDEEMARLQPPLLPLPPLPHQPSGPQTPLLPPPLAERLTSPPSPTPTLYEDAEEEHDDEACGPAPAPVVPAAAGPSGNPPRRPAAYDIPTANHGCPKETCCWWCGCPTLERLCGIAVCTRPACRRRGAPPPPPPPHRDPPPPPAAAPRPLMEGAIPRPTRPAPWWELLAEPPAEYRHLQGQYPLLPRFTANGRPTRCPCRAWQCPGSYFRFPGRACPKGIFNPRHPARQ